MSTDTNLTSTDQVLASILSAFGTLPPKEKKSRKPAKPANSSPRPFAQSFAQTKTGYTSWKAVARAIQMQEQICSCCGSHTTAVKGEYFQLENGQAHATWLRTEGYGIIAPEGLPNVFVDLEPTYVTACAECRSTPFDDLGELFSPRQLSLEL